MPPARLTYFAIAAVIFLLTLVALKRQSTISVDRSGVHYPKPAIATTVPEEETRAPSHPKPSPSPDGHGPASDGTHVLAPSTSGEPSTDAHGPEPESGDDVFDQPTKSGAATSEEVDDTVGPPAPGSDDFDPDTDGERLNMNDAECTAKFPGSYKELEIAVARGHIGAAPDMHMKDGKRFAPGHVRARIYNGQLYIVNRGGDVWHRMSAILHQIHRALLTAPDRAELPNIDFTFLVNDHPGHKVWSLARSDEEKEVHDTWLMPDFGFWSWPEPHIGSHHESREKIAAVDSTLTWAAKKDLAVWRGTRHWNARLRGKLLEVARGKPWSDVQELDWKKNALGMEDFCRYKFLIYTEGVTYSGRLRYFQHCRSIIITPPLQWRQYHAPLIADEGPNQNIVYVKEDWSDLHATVTRLLENPEEAERIANNTVNTFRDRYLTPASEACYWRKLFRAWASVTDPLPEMELKDRGTSWESWVLMGKLDWAAHA